MIKSCRNVIKILNTCSLIYEISFHCIECSTSIQSIITKCIRSILRCLWDFGLLHFFIFNFVIQIWWKPIHYLFIFLFWILNIFWFFYFLSILRFHWFCSQNPFKVRLRFKLCICIFPFHFHFILFRRFYLIDNYLWLFKPDKTLLNLSLDSCIWLIYFDDFTLLMSDYNWWIISWLLLTLLFIWFWIIPTFNIIQVKTVL